MASVKVLVVDDSAFMRRVIKQMIESDPEMTVVGTARDGVEGVEMALNLAPDVITMDVEMPRMNGIEAVDAIMEKRPTPIIMISSITTEGAKATFDALDRGAVDYLAKNLDVSSFDIMKLQGEIISKVKAVAKKRLPAAKKPSARPASAPPSAAAAPTLKKSVFATQKIAFVAIGASTGGPRALQEVLTRIPTEIDTPMLVAIHMPGAFTGAFAERLDSMCRIKVKLAQNGDKIENHRILISPGGMQTRVRRKGLSDFYIETSDSPHDALYKPTVDFMMQSAAECYPGRVMGVILTGMGHDGREGMKAIKATGGKTLAQNEESCTVYGMPKAVIEAGLADKVVALDSIAAEIVNMI